MARSTKPDYDFLTPWHALVSIWTMPLQSDVHKGFVFEQAETDSFFLALCGARVWDLALMSLVHDKKWRSNTLEAQWAFCCFFCCLDSAVSPDTMKVLATALVKDGAGITALQWCRTNLCWAFPV